VVIAAICQNLDASQWALGPALANLQDIIELINTNFNLNELSERLRNSKDVVLAAVRRDANNLAYASEELRADREFVLEAVKQNGYALEHSSEELRGDREVVLEAMMQDGRALQYASDGVKNEPMTVTRLNGTYGHAREFLIGQPAYVGEPAYALPSQVGGYPIADPRF